MFTRTIGFTGTIASGKSMRVERVRTLIPSLIAPLSFSVIVEVLNADRIGHSIYAPGTSCYDEVVHAFGPEILQPSTAGASLGAEIDRQKLGRVVFSNKANRLRLNQICWPRIAESIQRSHAALTQRQNVGVVVLVEAALLVELPEVLHLCDDIWVTHCDPETAVRRVVERDQLSASEAQQRVRSQMTYNEIRQRLSVVRFKGDVWDIDTSSDTKERGIQRMVDKFTEYWQRRVVKSGCTTTPLKKIK